MAPRDRLPCMNREPRLFGCLLFAAALAGCSSEPAKDAKKAAAPLHTVQGKMQVEQEATSTDGALNAGGPSLFLRDGVKRYRLFLKAPVEVNPDQEYIAEGVYAQKAIDEIGDPDEGAKAYPLASSCQRVIRMAWGGGMSFELADSHASVLRKVVGRYPARPIFLVTKLTPVPAKEGAKQEEEKELPEVAVPADKQKAQLLESAPVQTAPLWAPAGGDANCKVIIDEKGKVAELATGVQLCEAVDWAKYSYKPTAQGAKPVRVKTEVAVHFDPRK